MAPGLSKDTNGVNGAHAGLQWDSYQNVVDGKLESTKETRHGINPATGKPNPEVPVATPEDVDRAVAAAKKAFKTWSKTPWEERRKAIISFAEALEANKAAFAKMLTQEQGKPIQFASMEVDFSVHVVKTIAGLKLPEETMEDGDKEIVTRYTPLGVSVGIIPWNYPIVVAAGKICPSVLTGNPIIIKPSPFTPYCDLKLVEMAQEFFPPGVVQVLSGDDNLGPWMTAHPGIDKISFTGSSFTGKKVMASAAKTLKRVTLELGGNDPAIICDDVNIEEVAAKVATFAFLNSGQICVAIKRVFIQESIYPQFRDAMANFTKTLKVGEGNEENVFLGPIQNSMQYERVKGFFADIEKEKYKVAVGGKNDDGPGYFINPTIVDNPSEDSRLVKEEPFGPVVPLMTFTDDVDAVAKANDTRMGLGASIWSSNIPRANAIARQIEAGTVWVNTHFELNPSVSYGGHKESGIGAEWGVHGLMSYCNSQTLFLKKVPA